MVNSLLKTNLERPFQGAHGEFKSSSNLDIFKISYSHSFTHHSAENKEKIFSHPP